MTSNAELISKIKDEIKYVVDHNSSKSAIVSYSPGMFGGINVAHQLRVIFAEIGAPIIPSPFAIPQVHKVFENGNLIDESSNKRVGKFLNDFEWYMNALTNHRAHGTPY